MDIHIADLDSVEATAAASASRQKSCNACVKAKRKCDKRLPVCSRCVEKKCDCVYQNVPDGGDHDVFGSEAIGFIMQPLAVPMDLGFLPELNLGTASSSVDTAPLDIRNPMDIFAELTNTALSPPGGMWLVHDDTQGNQSADGDTGDSAVMADIYNTYEPWELYDPNSKIFFVTNAVKKFHALFARDSQAPFLHRHTYKDYMPPSILQCFTISSLYANKTEANKPMVFRSLQLSTVQLRQMPINTPYDKLARAQALLLYNTIRLFDGDVTLRAQAEEDMPLLESWLSIMLGCRQNLGNIYRMDEIAIRDNPPPSWEYWIFCESVRRTLIMGYSFMALYNLLRGARDDNTNGAWECVHRWTLSRHLWEAPSSFDFFRAWRDKPQYIIDSFNFENFIRGGKADDVDDFSRIVLTICIGLDETKQFFLDTGSEF